jgi:signal transduction histidine kinase/CheY-like chemotaxis protein
LGVRNLYWLAAAGALYIGVVTHYAGATPWSQVLAWWATVMALETPPMLWVRAFAHAPRADGELGFWALGKTVLGAIGTFGWGLGPAMLQVANEPGSIMIPTGGIVNVMASVVFAGACYPPSMIASLFSVLLFPGIVFTLQGGKVEEMLAICMFGALPFILLIGAYNARETRAAIAARLRIAELLALQRRQTEIVQEARLERNRFFSAASHDLRQPLHALGLYLALLRRSREAGERGEIEARIADCGESLDRQFDAILGVASTDTDLAASRPKPTLLGPAIERVAAIFRPQAAAKGLDLRTRPTAALAEVDREIFERVLANLVSNAVKYTETGGVRIRVAPSRGGWRVLVADSGVGIASAEQERIFRDFAQIGNFARERGKGLGLGLGIVKRLCEGMGWQISVRSRPGLGSVFAFDVQRGTQSSLPPELAGDAVTSVSAGGKVLIVDDDPLVRDAMRRLLEDWGYGASVAETGNAAIETLTRSNPETRWLVFLDCRMPGPLDGLALADAIKALKTRRVEIALMSGDIDSALAESVALRGLQLLAKPIKPITLRARLARWAGSALA